MLAAGAAGLALAAGSASADTGLSGTLDQVSSTVAKATGGSAPHATKAPRSSGAKALASRASTTKAAPRVSVRRAVVKPVVRPVARTVHHVAKPVARVAPAPVQKAVKHAAPPKQTVKKPVVNKPIVTKPVVTKPVVTKPVVTKPVVTKPVVTKPVVKKPPATPVPAAVTVQAATTVSTQLLAGVSSSVLPPSPLTSAVTPVLTTVLPPLDLTVDLGLDVAVGVPALDVGPVTLPGGTGPGLPPVVAPVDDPVLPATPAVSSPRPSVVGLLVPSGAAAPVAPARSASAATTTVTPQLLGGPRPLTTADDSRASGSHHAGATPTISALDASLSLLAGLGTAGAGLGAASDATAAAGGPGLVLLGLVAAVGLVGPAALRPQPAQGRSGHLSRLLRQPGFSPD